MVTASGARPRSAHSAGGRRRCRRRAWPRRGSVRVDRVRELIARAHRAADARLPRTGPRQRARAESGAGRGARRAPAPTRSTAGRGHTWQNVRAGSRSGIRRIVRQAIVDPFTKLDPRVQIKNPVMFIVEVGSLLTTIVFVQELAERHRPAALHRPGRVLALVHRALRQLRRGDGRRPRQGAGGHAAQDARPRRWPTGSRPTAASRPCRRASLRKGDVVRVARRRVHSRPTARSSRASPRWTSRRSPASRRRSSANPAATARRSPAARACCRTGSWCASPPIPATRSSIG